MTNNTHKKTYKKEISFLVFFVLMISTLTFASNSDIVKIQGRVMNLDFEKKMLIVNERSFFWDQNTTFKNEKDSATTFDRLKPKTWVYVEGEYNKAIKKLTAKRIYLLPKYIEAKERHLYPFME